MTYAVSGFSGTSVLASFQQFGRDATVDVDGNVLQGATAPLPANILQTPTVGVQGQWQLRATTTAPGALTLGVSARPDPTFGPRDLNWKSEISYYIDDALEVRIRPNGISSGDFSGNGRTELLAWAADTECASVTISLRSGRSVVLPLPRIGPPGGCQARVFVGDFDGDGVDDIAAASKDSLTAALSRGAGAFEITSRAPWSGTNGSCTVSDIDGDGRADIVCRDAIANQIRVYFSRGTSWELGTISTAGPAEPNIVTGAKTWLVGGDVDGDGFPDLVLLEANSQGFKVHVGRSMGDGTLAWQAPIQLNSPLADESDVQLTDIDGDGRADLAITNPNPTFHVYLNKRGAFTQRWQMMPAVTNDLRYVQFVDLDGDAVQILLAEI